MSKDNNLFFIPIHDMETVDIHSKKMGGQPCLSGTRFPLAQFLAELSETTIKDFAQNYNYDPKFCRKVLKDLATVITKEYYMRKGKSWPKT